jgi:RNase P/RNase MRP subunit p30
MVQDVVFPDGNEESLVIFAKKLGFSEIIFTYAYHDSGISSKLARTISEKLEKIGASSKINHRFAFVLSKNTLNNAQSLKEKGFITFVDISKDFQGRSFERDELDKFLRTVAASRFIDGVFCLEKVSTKKGLHYRNSGMNHIHAKMFFDNNIMLLENHKDIFPDSCRRGNLSGIMQNAILSEKYAFPMSFFSFARKKEELSSPEDLKSVSRLFGISKDRSNMTFFSESIR